MNLFGFQTPEQTGFDYPAPLTEKYRPARVQDFAGLDKVKRILSKLVSNPRPINLLFVGPSGTGKSTMAVAFGNELQAELHHVPSQECTVSRLEDIVARCHYMPMAGKKMHLILVDEADQMSPAAQLYLLWVFTCNETDRFQERFIFRTMRVDFSSYGLSTEASELLQRVWFAEGGTSDSMPNFARIVKEPSNNIRQSLIRLESELLAA